MLATVQKMNVQVHLNKTITTIAADEKANPIIPNQSHQLIDFPAALAGPNLSNIIVRNFF